MNNCTLQIKSNIHSLLKIKLKQCTMMPMNILTCNRIITNNKNTSIEKTTCKDFYMHSINTCTYSPTSIQKWCNHYPDFNNTNV